MDPQVSIIIPTYNYGSFIKDCIESVFAQTFQRFEILVIDDGSTDDTPQILEGFSDPRLNVVRTLNSGVSAARNTGLDLAKGSLIAFLDADDRWLPHKLETQVAAFENDPEIGFVFSNFTRFNENGDQLADQFSFSPELKDLQSKQIPGTEAYKINGNALIKLLNLSDMPWYPPANMVKASLAKSEKFPENLKIAEDVSYFLRIWSKTRCAFIPQISAEIRRHGNNATHAIEISHNLIMLDVLSNISDVTLNDEQKYAIRKRKGREWANCGYRLWEDGRYLEASSAYMHAIRYPGKRVNALKHLLVVPYAIAAKMFK